MLRTRYIWGDPLQGSGNIEPDRHQLPPRAGRVLRCSTGGRADAALRRAAGLDIGQINFILHAINCVLRVDIRIHNPHNFSYGSAIKRSTQPRIRTMNVRDKLAVKKAKLEKLKKEIAMLQAEAVEGGFAYYVQSTRNKVPNKGWWMEQHPKTWERYMTKTPVNTFTWKD